MTTLPEDKDYIVGLKSQHVEHIADFELTLAEEFKSFIVLTGDNGAGKTWLLEQIFKAITQKINVIKNYGEGQFIVRAIEQGNLINFFYTIQNNNSEMLRRIRVLSSKLAVYNANRLRIHSEQSTASNMRKDYFGTNPFDYDCLLRNGEYWLKMKLLAGREDLVQEGMNVLKSLMPNVIKVDYRQDEQEGVIFQYHTKNSVESIETISAGNKVILALIGDLFFRLWDNQLNIKQAKDLTGIVLIDEIEAHLHPNWQRKFPQLLAQTFPKVQFVVSTHTPMTILGLPKNSVLLHVDNNEQGKITVEQLELDFWNMLPQQILTSPVFGLESLRSVYNEDLEELHTEENYKELLENQKVKDTIDEWSKSFKAKKSERE
jgi:predicted ATP-binding protein involved in virulence